MQIPLVLIQASRYSLIGIIAAFVHYCVALFCIWYLALVISLANVIAFLCAVWISFLGHRYFTFREQNSCSKKSFTKFFIVAILGFIFNETVLISLNSLKLFSIQINLFLTISVTAVLTFILNKYFTFELTKR